MAQSAQSRQVAPAVEELAREMAGKLKVVRIDVERSPLLARELRIPVRAHVHGLRRGAHRRRRGRGARQEEDGRARRAVPSASRGRAQDCGAGAAPSVRAGHADRHARRRAAFAPRSTCRARFTSRSRRCRRAWPSCTCCPVSRCCTAAPATRRRSSRRRSPSRASRWPSSKEGCSGGRATASPSSEEPRERIERPPSRRAQPGALSRASPGAHGEEGAAVDRPAPPHRRDVLRCAQSRVDRGAAGAGARARSEGRLRHGVPYAEAAGPSAAWPSSASSATG